MVRRLVELDYLARRDNPGDEDVRWWLEELRTPSYLMELAKSYPDTISEIKARPWLEETLKEGETAIKAALLEEQMQIRKKDQDYWKPLRVELERLRQGRRK